MSRKRQFPKGSLTEIREYVPALRHADQVLRREARRLKERVEARELELLHQTRSELTELRDIVSCGRKVTPDNGD